MKTVYIISGDPYGIDLDSIKPGDRFILVEKVNINSGSSNYYLRRDNGEGIPGNMDSNIKRYHGWRGSSNSTSVYAEGLRQVEKVYYVKGDLFVDQRAKIKLSADLLPDVP